MKLDGIVRKVRAAKTHTENLHRIALSSDTPAGIRLRASLEILKALDPVTWDSTYRRRIDEAEEPELLNTRIQYQGYMDKRDARIQAENAAKAMQAREEDDGPEGQLSMQLFFEDLRKIQDEAGQDAAKQADD